MISAPEIQALKDAATEGPWSRGRLLNTDVVRAMNEEEKARISRVESHFILSNFLTSDKGRSRKLVTHIPSENPNWEADADFVAALPDIAQTALDALARVEELETRIHNEFVMGNIIACFDSCDACAGESPL